MRRCFLLFAAALLTGATLQGASGTTSGRLVVRSDSRTGRLIRSVAVPAQRVRSLAVAPDGGSGLAAASPGNFDAIVDEVAARHEVEPNLVHSVIRVESNYNPRAISPKGALGIMQLIPATARRFGVENVFDAADNIEGGVKYLKHLLDYYDGNHALALAAYNAGEGAVARFRGIPPYPETQNYVAQVWKHWGAANRRRPAGSEHNSDPAADAPAHKDSREYNRIEESIDDNGSVVYLSR
jgi:hypothetical protein